MQGVKTTVKTMLFGNKPRPYRMRAGLLRGLRFEVDVRIDTQQITGLYERELLGPVRRLAARAHSAFDIGAGDGYYTVYFAAQPGITKVVACEPDPQRSRLLQRNLSLNSSRGIERVSLLPVCVGSSKASGFQDLESLVKGSAEPVLLKIDVEGAELDVLESGRAALSRGDFLIVIETHSAELERDCAAFLEKLGYKCAIVKNGWYRKIIPELRFLPHNRWLIAERPQR